MRVMAHRSLSRRNSFSSRQNANVVPRIIPSTSTGKKSSLFMSIKIRSWGDKRLGVSGKSRAILQVRFCKIRTKICQKNIVERLLEPFSAKWNLVVTNLFGRSWLPQINSFSAKDTPKIILFFCKSTFSVFQNFCSDGQFRWLPPQRCCSHRTSGTFLLHCVDRSWCLSFAKRSTRKVRSRTQGCKTWHFHELPTMQTDEKRQPLSRGGVANYGVCFFALVFLWIFTCFCAWPWRSFGSWRSRGQKHGQKICLCIFSFGCLQHLRMSCRSLQMWSRRISQCQVGLQLSPRLRSFHW